MVLLLLLLLLLFLLLHWCPYLDKLAAPRFSEFALNSRRNLMQRGHFLEGERKKGKPWTSLNADHVCLFMGSRRKVHWAGNGVKRTEPRAKRKRGGNGEIYCGNELHSLLELIERHSGDKLHAQMENLIQSSWKRRAPAGKEVKGVVPGIGVNDLLQEAIPELRRMRPKMVGEDRASSVGTCWPI
ncbi:hypothetical protein CAPTEDRAFT_218293 [Capitella teleta]|uniref:Uncharacterized protein n=1 Tax=Capitella teleta TaxID=283909 RepID=R7TXW8_CAPTE|nr:hypothetical protein CAPTEDRAFT_218293 [Capitella teleta]|eukprot:ELT98589.1 hypothetical protein CAPTEDRAFT_218293 [Capitella teleta]